jgi:hypothetical protein
MKPMIAAVLLLGLGAAPALSQDNDINSIIASIGGSAFLTAAESAEDAGSVRVERLSSFAGSAQAAGRLDSVVSLKSDDLEYLHASLITNPIARTAINNSGFGIGDIVALSMAGGGALILYADDL